MTIKPGAQLPFGKSEVPRARDSRSGAVRRRRNSFNPYTPPTEPMSKSTKAWGLGNDLPQLLPPEMAPLVDWIKGQENARERFRWVLRDSLDECLDGQRTGRWCYQHLTKTEKTYLGTAVEVNLTKEFDIQNGVDLDWRIADVDVDCKFSKDLGGWEIPMEMYVCVEHGERSGRADRPALLVWFDDDVGRWAVGVIVIEDQLLRWKLAKGTNERVRAYNRDNKRRLDDKHVEDIYWLWGGLQADLPTNLILALPDEVRERIFAFTTSGQKRVNQLFREVQGRIVGRRTVLTVAQQDDAPKRARDARVQLRDEGILILGHQELHSKIARALGLMVPVKGEWIAARVRPAAYGDPQSFEVDAACWTLATDADPVVQAPALPEEAAHYGPW